MHDRSKIILSDCDGVILAWEQQFHIWMKARGYTRVNNSVYNIEHTYDIVRDRAEQLIQEFNTSAYMIDLPPFRDALSGIATLREAGYKFIAITSVGSDPHTARLRKINLEDLFGKDVFLEIHCMDGNKRPYLEPYKDSGLFWIEDLEKNAVLGADLGLQSILLTHAYNLDCVDHRIRRVQTWKDITEIILDNSGS